jgi:hypothetical protein
VNHYETLYQSEQAARLNAEEEWAALKRKYEILEGKYKILEGKYETLEGEYGTLEEEFNQWKALALSHNDHTRRINPGIHHIWSTMGELILNYIPLIGMVPAFLLIRTNYVAKLFRIIGLNNGCETIHNVYSIDVDGNSFINLLSSN